MSQASLALPTTGTVSGLTMAQDINAALDALNTANAGASAPANAQGGVAEEGQYWLNTSGSSPFALNIYDGAQWVLDAWLDTANHQLLAPIGGGTATLASAATVDLGSVPQSKITISGTTAITSFGASMKPGQMKVVTFAAALTLTYNAASLILPGAANITTAANDQALVVSIASGNYILFYQPASGKAVVGGTAVAPVIASGRNIVVKQASTTTVTASWDELVLKTGLGGTATVSASGSFTLNAATTGKNGLDTGSLANSTFYALYAYLDAGTTPAVIASTSFTAPSLPGGGTSATLIGWFQTDGSAHIKAFTQFDRTTWFVAQNALAATSNTAYTSLSISSIVPSIAKTAFGVFGNTNGGATAIAADANGTGKQQVTAAATGSVLDSYEVAADWSIPLITAQTIFYKTTSSTNGQIDVTGCIF